LVIEMIVVIVVIVVETSVVFRLDFIEAKGHRLAQLRVKWSDGMGQFSQCFLGRAEAWAELEQAKKIFFEGIQE
jgi:hypothetical protein